MRNDEPLVTVAVFNTLFDAAVARGALEATGIRALVPEETLVRPHAFFTTARVQVFESDSARAQVELRRMQIRLVQPDTDGSDGTDAEVI
jgi:hypothetical protein